MQTAEMARYAGAVAFFFVSVFGPSVGLLRRHVLRTEKAREIVFGLGCGVGGVVGMDSAHRLLAGQGVAAYLYVIGLPLAPFAVLYVSSRLGLWRPEIPFVRRPAAPAKSRVR